MFKKNNDGFTETEIEMAKIARALSHPARIRILKELAECSRCICGDLVELLPLSQSTVSQHLKELKKAGLIKGEIEGPRTCYCLNPEKLRKSFEHLSVLFDSLNCCED